MRTRRFLPRDNPYRTDPRWKQREPLSAPAVRTHERQLRYVAEIDALRARAGIKKTEIDELVSKRGVRDVDPWSRLSYHDIIRDTPIDPAHTIAVVCQHHHDCFRGKRKLTPHLPAEGQARRSTGKRARITTEKYSFVRVVGHEDDDDGERSRYQVLWTDGTKTWEEVEPLTQDVGSGEGLWNNSITRYEDRLKETATSPSPSPATPPTATRTSTAPISTRSG